MSVLGPTRKETQVEISLTDARSIGVQALIRESGDIEGTALVEVVTDALAKGDKVSLKGFGNFEVRTRSERTGRNPRTGETMTIAASKAPAFKASSALKKAVNK